MAPPVRLSEVDLHTVFTGIVSYAPGDGGGCKCAEEVRFIMPNTRVWRPSRSRPGKLIPPHEPFLIALECDVALDGNGFWKGKQPTGRLFDRWVYWRLTNDNIRINAMPKTGVTFGKTDAVVRLADLCPEAELDDECIRGETGRVGARVVFTAGRLSQKGLTTDKYKFETCAQGTTRAKEIADEILVILNGLPLVNGDLILNRRRLNDGRSGRTPIILHPQRRMTQIFFGSAPEADLGAVVSRVENHPHGNTNFHFELHYDLSRRRPFPPIPVPEFAGSGTGGPISGSDRCPPTAGGPKPTGA